jgi:hypothetical protein
MGHVIRGLGFGQDAAPERDDGVGGEDQRVIGLRGHGARLGNGEAQGIEARDFALQGRFIDIGGDDLMRLQPRLPEQSKTARAGAREDQPRGRHARQSYLKR